MLEKSIVRFLQHAVHVGEIDCWVMVLDLPITASSFFSLYLCTTENLNKVYVV